MTPFSQASAVYDREPCSRTFDEDLLLHLEYGYVFSTPVAFIMGRPVLKDADESAILDPTVAFGQPDAWLIWLAAGDLREFWRFCPFELPWVGWQKRNLLRFYPTQTVKDMTYARTVVKSSGTSGQYRDALSDCLAM